jgi:hypothetical protein
MVISCQWMFTHLFLYLLYFISVGFKYQPFAVCVLRINMKRSPYIIKHHAIETYGGVEVYFLTLALTGRKWSASQSGTFTPGRELRYQLDRQMDGPKTRPRLSETQKSILPPFESNPGYTDWSVSARDDGCIFALINHLSSLSENTRKLGS